MSPFVFFVPPLGGFNYSVHSWNSCSFLSSFPSLCNEHESTEFIRKNVKIRAFVFVFMLEGNFSEWLFLVEDVVDEEGDVVDVDAVVVFGLGTEN